MPDSKNVTVSEAELEELRKDRVRLEYVLWNHFRCAEYEATSFQDRADIDQWIAVEPDFTGELTA